MSYNTVEQFLSRAFPKGRFDNEDRGTIQLFLDSAAEDIDGALRSHHTLPLATVPANVLDAEAVMAAYRLLLLVGGQPDSNEALAYRYVEITGEKGWLYRLSQGHVLLAQEADSTPDVNEGAPAVLTTAGRSSRGIRTFCDGKEFV